MINDIKVAFAFLTRIPIKHNEPVRLNRSAVWFPLVGFIVGLISGLTYFALANFFSTLVASVIAILLGIFITGAFHQDGLADIFDGLVGGFDKEQRLKILKDSRHGTYGVTSLVLQIVLQIVVLSEFPAEAGFVALIVIHTLARLVPIFLMLTPAAENHEGMGAAISREVTLRQVLGSTALTIFLLAWLLGFYLIPLAMGLSLVIVFFYKYVNRKIGGVVGDAFGAGEQISESIILLILLVFSELGLRWILIF